MRSLSCAFTSQSLVPLTLSPCCCSRHGDLFFARARDLQLEIQIGCRRRMWVGGFKQMHPWKRAVHSLAPVRPAVPPRHTYTSSAHQLKEDMTSAACVLCARDARLGTRITCSAHALTNRNNCAHSSSRSSRATVIRPNCGAADLLLARKSSFALSSLASNRSEAESPLPKQLLAYTGRSSSIPRRVNIVCEVHP